MKVNRWQRSQTPLMAATRSYLDATEKVAEAPWSVAEWAVALRFDNPRATVLVRVLG